jgi:hypothetical protein
VKIEYSKGERASKELMLLNRRRFESSTGRKMDGYSMKRHYGVIT